MVVKPHPHFRSCGRRIEGEGEICKKLECAKCQPLGLTIFIAHKISKFSFARHLKCGFERMPTEVSTFDADRELSDSFHDIEFALLGGKFSLPLHHPLKHCN